MKQFNLEEYLANPSKKIITRDGCPVRIICTDRRNIEYPIVALIEDKSGESIYIYTKDGKIIPNDLNDWDLFFAPEKHEGWVTMYRDSNNGHTTGAVFDSPEDAERVGQQKLFSYVTTIKIEWEE